MQLIIYAELEFESVNAPNPPAAYQFSSRNTTGHNSVSNGEPLNRKTPIKIYRFLF